MKSILSAVFWMLATTIAFDFAAFPVSAQTAKNLRCKGCVNSRDLGNKAVTGIKIRKNSIVSSKIKDGSVAPVDLHSSSKPAGLSSVEGDQAVEITIANKIVRSVTITAPGPGKVLVMASWFFNGINDIGVCTVTTGNGTESDAHVTGEMAGDVNYVPASAVRSFDVAAGSSTFNLVCAASFGNPSVSDSSMTALFVPGSY